MQQVEGSPELVEGSDGFRESCSTASASTDVAIILAEMGWKGVGGFEDFKPRARPLVSHVK